MRLCIVAAHVPSSYPGEFLDYLDLNDHIYNAKDEKDPLWLTWNIFVHLVKGK